MTRTTRVTTALLAVSLSVLLAACGSDSSSTTEGSASTSKAAAASNSAPDGTPAAGPHNAADVMFATMMIPHHAQAVEMSRLLLDKDGVDPDVMALAEQIAAAQGPEIEQMRGWLAGWGSPVPESDGSMMGNDMGGMDHGLGTMAGTMSDEEMAKLESADGADGSRLFLQQMTAHHEGAVAMAKDELAAGENADAKALATAIISAQETEIATMADLLAG